MLRYKEVKQMLAELIADKRNGDRLPSRISLSRQLDSSRATIDKAIRELTEEGMLESRFGSGTYVARRLDGVVSNQENWCLIVPDISEAVSAQLASGVEKEASARGANVILCSSDGRAEKQAEYIQRLMMAGVDGFLIVPAITRSAEENIALYRSLCRSQIPFVFCNRDVEGIDAPIVKSNDFYGGYIATQYLIALGYRRIVFLSRQRYRTSVDRCQGYISALQERGIAIDRRLILMLEQDSAGACGEALLRLLDAGIRVDAVFCFNDVIALETMRQLQQRGIRIPDEMGMIGYDNIDACQHAQPSLTTVSYQMTDIGRMAARVLSKLLDHGQTDGFAYYLLQPEIVVRSSCRSMDRLFPKS